MHKIIAVTAITAASAVVFLGLLAARALVGPFGSTRGEQARVDREFRSIMLDANRRGVRWAD